MKQLEEFAQENNRAAESFLRLYVALLPLPRPLFYSKNSRRMIFGKKDLKNFKAIKINWKKPAP